MSVESILLAMAQNAGRARRDKGAAIADVVGGLSQAPAQYYAGRDQQRALMLRQQQQQQQIDLEAARGRREDAQATRQAGLDARANTAQDAADMREKALKNAIRKGFEKDPSNFDLPAGIDQLKVDGAEDLAPTLAAVHDKFVKPAVKTREVKTLNADGSETVRIVPDAPGAFTGAAPAPKMHPVTTTGPNGGPIVKLVSEEELQKGVPAYRDPKSNEPNKFWIFRDGKPLRISEADYKPGDLPSNTREQGRPVTSGDAGRIAENVSSLDDVQRLKDALSAAGETGTFAKIGASMPNVITDLTGWGTDAKKKQATIDRVKQVIGKALEGGVLRKEDELKYEKILPTIGDTTEVVKSKLNGLESAIRQKNERFLESLSDAGYETGKFTQTKAAEAPASGGLSYADYLKAKKKP